MDERSYWDDYMHAYEEALRATARPWAPWYAIPADSKPFMRVQVADIIVKTMNSLGLAYPTINDEARAELVEMKKVLEENL